MKLKKFFFVLFTTMMLLTFSSAANAATGIGDTKENAITAHGSDYFQLFIQNSQDVDWYVYTNNSGQMGYFTAFLNSSDYEKFRLGFQIKYPDGRESSILYNDPYIGPSLSIRDILVPDGAKVYIVVRKTDDNLAQYRLGFSAP